MKPQPKRASRRKATPSAKPTTDAADGIPETCDFICPFAEFPPAETSGICRTMSAVWCEKLKELVEKNQPCQWRARQKS